MVTIGDNCCYFPTLSMMYLNDLLTHVKKKIRSKAWVGAAD